MRKGLALKRKAKTVLSTFKAIGKPKIFCVGLNKTGTTSLKKEMENLGYIVGDKKKGRNMIDFWAKREFKPIIRFCKTAEFFQDAPFSFPYTFIALDQAFPNSKFILLLRDSQCR